jgi:EAL and modified HD-GYP domain-containing signal transduction protein
MPGVHVGRQPIFDRSMDVLGYELLFRATSDATTAADNGDLATSHVIVNTFTEFGLDRLVNGRLAFVNVTRSFVVGDMPIPMHPAGVVLELLEDIPVDDEVLAGVRRLRADGFRIALHDFIDDDPRGVLLPEISYVKFDLHQLEPDRLAVALRSCRGFPAQLIAERVESLAEMARCAELGFDYFQGYGLLRPDVVSLPGLSASQLACFQLMSRLSDPDISISEIEDVLRTDVGLSYRLLGAVRAAHIGSVQRVASIRQAIVLLGMQRLRSWLLLLAMTQTNRPSEEQLSAALTRARTCELLALSLPPTSAESAFVVGLLSSLDDVIGVPLSEIVSRLPLAADISTALESGGGPLGDLLALVRAHESGADLPAIAGSIDPFEISRAYLSAVGWSLQVCSSALVSA